MLSQTGVRFGSPSMNSDTKLIAVDVVRQQFVLGINCSIFLYLNSFGANQRLESHPEVLQNFTVFTLEKFCSSSAGQGVCECSAVMGLTPCMYVHIYCLLCVCWIITEVTKSQRNRRRQRRLQIFPKNFTFEAWKINVK